MTRNIFSILKIILNCTHPNPTKKSLALPDVAELVYQKYIRPAGASRLDLWLFLAYVRQYPVQRALLSILPREAPYFSPQMILRKVDRVLEILNGSMVEVHFHDPF